MAFYSFLSHLQTLSPLPSDARAQEHPTQIQHPPRNRLHLRIKLKDISKRIPWSKWYINGNLIEKLKHWSWTVCAGRAVWPLFSFKASIISIVAYLLKATPIRKGESPWLIVFSLSHAHKHWLPRSTSMTFSLLVRSVNSQGSMFGREKKSSKMLTC